MALELLPWTLTQIPSTSFQQVIEQLPFPLQIFSLDGFARYINQACIEQIGISSAEEHIGHYNVFEDPIVIQQNAVEEIRRVLQGEVVILSDFQAHYQDLVQRYPMRDRDVVLLSSDIINFPIFDSRGEQQYFASLFMVRKVYQNMREVSRARAYIEEQWYEKFDSKALAAEVHLSVSHLNKLFKKHYGVTPHQYYVQIKVQKLKEKFLDPNLSVAQAFAACNMDYNGHTARMFRDHVGVSPSTYRNKLS